MELAVRDDTSVMIKDNQEQNHSTPKNHDEPESYHKIVSEEHVRNDR